MSKEKGLYKKYNVSRTDGKPVGDCIVLEFEDSVARDGIAAWADSLRRQGYKQLSIEVWHKLREYIGTEKEGSDDV